MVDKLYELKANYEAEIERLQIKVEVINDLLALVPAEEPTEDECLENLDENEQDVISEI